MRVNNSKTIAQIKQELKQVNKQRGLIALAVNTALEIQNKL